MGLRVQIHPGILCDNTEIEDGDDFIDEHGDSDVLSIGGRDIYACGHSVTAMDINGGNHHFA